MVLQATEISDTDLETTLQNEFTFALKMYMCIDTKEFNLEKMFVRKYEMNVHAGIKFGSLIWFFYLKSICL